MPQNVVFNGTTYAIPLAGELNWSSLSNFLIDVGTNAAVDTDQKQSIRVALSSPVIVAATSDYAVFSNLTVPGAVAVTLPAGINGQVFVIGDGKGDAATNNITITPNGAETINGLSTLVLNKARQVAIIQYHLGSTDWKIQVVTIPPGTIVDSDISSLAAIARAKVAAGSLGDVVINDPATGLLSSEPQLAKTRGGTGISSTATFPSSGVVVTEAATETLSNKTLTQAVIADYEDFTEIATPGTNPAPGSLRIYAKSDDTFYSKNSAGVETAIGGGGSGVTTMLPFGTAPNANAGTITGSDLELEPASASFPGGISTVLQSLAGLKKFIAGVSSVGWFGTDPDVGGSSPFTLLDTSYRQQSINSASNAVIILPTTGILKGETFSFTNRSGANTLEVQASDASSIDIIHLGVVTVQALIDTPVSNADWMVTDVHENYYNNIANFTLTGASAVSGSSMVMVKRDNKLIYVAATFPTTTPDASTIGMMLSGFSIDSGQLPSSGSGTLLGHFYIAENDATPRNLYQTGFAGVVWYDGGTTNQVFMTTNTDNNGFLKMNGNTILFTNSMLTCNFIVPIN